MENKKILYGIIAILVLVLSCAVVGVIYIQKQGLNVESLISFLIETKTGTKTGVTGDKYLPPVENVSVTPKIYQDTQVQWYAAPKVVASPKLFVESNDLGENKTWEMGVILNGTYAGDKIFLVVSPSYGPGPNLVLRFIGKDTSTLTFLSRYSSDNIMQDFYGIDKKVVRYSDDSFIINSLEYPGIFSLNNIQIKKEFDFPVKSPDYDKDGKMLGNIYDGVFFDATYLKKIFNDPLYGDVYTTDASKVIKDKENIYTENGFYVKVADGTFKVYSMSVDIMGAKDVPNVIWNDGKKASAPYTYKGVNGCGSASFVDDVADGEFKEGDLMILGKTSKGDPVYGVKDINNAYLKKWYQENQDLVKSFGGSDNYFKFKSAMTYEQFMENYPMFFWKDPMGRLLRFINKDMVITGGCGKPVIYLYPEQKTKVSVKISPTGGLTVTEPKYNSGWNVIADPESNLKNLADGKTYPYLYWEGRSDLVYRIPSRGFVIDKDNLENLLNEKLALLGLIPKEINDFKDFWLPRMRIEDKPYYFVTFNSRAEIDRLAPLEINPQPDTIIRVLMDYKALDNPIEAQGFDIQTPERHGFTAVEWGGVLK